MMGDEGIAGRIKVGFGLQRGIVQGDDAVQKRQALRGLRSRIAAKSSLHDGALRAKELAHQPEMP